MQIHTERGLRLQHCLEESKLPPGARLGWQRTLQGKPLLGAVMARFRHDIDALSCQMALSLCLLQVHLLLQCPWRWMRSIHGKLLMLQQLRRSSSAPTRWRSLLAIVVSLPTYKCN